jgi:hypothetical protein
MNGLLVSCQGNLKCVFYCWHRLANSKAKRSLSSSSRPQLVKTGPPYAAMRRGLVLYHIVRQWSKCMHCTHAYIWGVESLEDARVGAKLSRCAMLYHGWAGTHDRIQESAPGRRANIQSVNYPVSPNWGNCSTPIVPAPRACLSPGEALHEHCKVSLLMGSGQHGNTVEQQKRRIHKREKKPNHFTVCQSHFWWIPLSSEGLFR